MSATNKIPHRSDWFFENGSLTELDKEQLVQSYILYMLDKTQMIFEYQNLPDTIPSKDLELLLQCNGNATIAEHNGKLYAFRGGLGGVPNEYYMPTISIVANPYLKLNKEYKIDEDCIVMNNDSIRIGLLPLFKNKALLLSEIDLSIRIATINSRTPSIISADDDNTKASADAYMDEIIDGRKIGVVLAKSFADGLKTHPYASSSNNVKDLIELKQYTLASWYNEMGLQSQFNMKREAINESEASMNDDVLLPLIDDMMSERKKGCEKINKMYGTNISVDFNSAWKKIRDEIVRVDHEPKDEPQNEPVEEPKKDGEVDEIN